MSRDPACAHDQGKDFAMLPWDRRHPCRPPLSGRDAGTPTKLAHCPETPLETTLSGSVVNARRICNAGAPGAQPSQAHEKVRTHTARPLSGDAAPGQDGCHWRPSRPRPRLRAQPLRSRRCRQLSGRYRPSLPARLCRSPPARRAPPPEAGAATVRGMLQRFRGAPDPNRLLTTIDAYGTLTMEAPG